MLGLVTAGRGSLHPRELSKGRGGNRELNGWGGYSAATTRTLHALHHQGLLRVAGREKGIRLYEAACQTGGEGIELEVRLRKLVLLIAAILQPVPVRSLRAALGLLAHAAPGFRGRVGVVDRLADSGELASGVVEGVRYVWPEGRVARTEDRDSVRFLAPFDPLVWDRRRFEHFWGWGYRFEAYTPAVKRKMGYYAMPLLWRDEVVGWVNAARTGGGLGFSPGFAFGEPGDRAFWSEFEREAERFRGFMASEESVRGGETGNRDQVRL